MSVCLGVMFCVVFVAIVRDWAIACGGNYDDIK